MRCAIVVLCIVAHVTCQKLGNSNGPNFERFENSQWSRLLGGARKQLFSLLGLQQGSENVIPNISNQLDEIIVQKCNDAQVKSMLYDAGVKISENKLSESMEILVSAVEACDTSNEAYQNLGAVLLAMNLPSYAEGVLYTAVSMSKWESSNSIANLAEALRLNGDLDLAERVIAKGMQSIPSANMTPLIAFTMGSIQENKKNYSSAADWYLSSALQFQNNLEAWVQASTLGFPEQFRDYKFAENVLLQALDSNPNSPTILFQLALAFHQQNRLAEAIPLYQEVLRLDTSHSIADTRSVLATALHAHGKINEALSAYLLAEQEQSTNVVLLANYAILLCQAGAANEGLAKSRRALALNSSSVDAIKAAEFCRNMEL